jgi:hypothetical protein
MGEGCEPQRRRRRREQGPQSLCARCVSATSSLQTDAVALATVWAQIRTPELDDRV